MDDETFFDGERGCGLFLKTGEQLLLRLARKGEIPSFRLGKRDVLFTRPTSARLAAPMQTITTVKSLSISISCETNFSFLLLDHVLGCRRSGS
jgi:hypothetical protein